MVLTSIVGQTENGLGFVCDLSSLVNLCVQDDRSLHVVVTMSATIQRDTDGTVTS